MNLAVFNLAFIFLSNGKLFVQSQNIKKNDLSMPKLLVVLIDGFRWDYIDLHLTRLDAFRQFISEGVQVQWLEPVFPSMSFPNWMTISTGLFPESHGILGNYMLDIGEGKTHDAEFSLFDRISTFDTRWYTHEPIWTTASKHNRNAFLANWARCDVPFENISPAYCTGYEFAAVSTKLWGNLDAALQRLESDCQFAMVYDSLVDNVAHAFGPGLIQQIALWSVNYVLSNFDANVKSSSLKDKLNIVILSDHGMTSTQQDTGVTYVFLRDYVNTTNIYKVVDFGAIASIAAVPNSKSAVDELMRDLKFMPGVDAYRKQDIPEEFHYRNSPLALDILLVARQGYAIVGLRGDKQLPHTWRASEAQPFLGNHGYYNMTDMRGIFLARGPAFKKGLMHNHIRMEDVYQIFTHVLNIPSLPNNGSWERVKGMFSNV